MFQSMQRFLMDVWANQTTRMVLLFTIVLILVLVAIYLVQKVRQLAVGGASRPPDTLTDFRHMKEKGLLDEQEYRRVRTVVTPSGDGVKTKQGEKTFPLTPTGEGSSDPPAP